MPNSLYLLFLLLPLTLCYICQGSPNPLPTLTIPPTLTKSHLHGQKYTIQHNGSQLHIVNLTGTAYQMGLAYGSLMKQQIKSLVQSYFHYIYEHADQEVKLIKKLPAWVQPAAKSVTLAALRQILRVNGWITRKYTPRRFQEELDGLAEGSGVDRDALVEINMIPEYTKAGCSILGAWGKATKNDELLHLRALDWDFNAPINDFPAIIVYHPKQHGSQPFANVGWPGFVGSITGFGENIGIGEKVRSQSTNQNQTRFGKPWNYAVRDTLQFATNIDEALQQLGQTDRTCSIYLGISSKVNNTFRLVQYSKKEFTVYHDHNFPFTNKHGQFDNIVYMPIHDDNSECFNDLIKENYGRIDSDWIMRTLAPLHKTGDTQLAVYSFKTRELLVQYSRGGVQAYKRNPLLVRLGDFL